MSLAAGERFDWYVIEELLGEGGMARVYRARDPRLHRRVALKVLRADASAGPEGAAAGATLVLREARAAAALDHPNAISVFDVGEADGQLFMAMELVVGKSLRAYVGDTTTPWQTKLRWLVDAARALGAAHKRGLLHRDIKPENVMVRDDGVIKVLDFGIAKPLVVDDPRAPHVPGDIAGTPSYLSPEQLRGEAVDCRADEFAWGVTAYELLTGRLPWPRGADGFQLVRAILERLPEPPSKRVLALPSIVDATIMKALAKSAAQRFDSMENVVTALEGIGAIGRQSWAEIPMEATTKTEPAPPFPPSQGGAQEGGRTMVSPLGPRPRGPVLRRAAAAALFAVGAAVVTALVAARMSRLQDLPAETGPCAADGGAAACDGAPPAD